MARPSASWKPNARHTRLTLTRWPPRKKRWRPNWRRRAVRLTEAAQVKSNAEQAMRSVDGDAAAARAEAKRQEALADIRQVSERYVRVRSSAMLLQWVIDRYRREKQAPLLKRASELFAKVTSRSVRRSARRIR